MKTFDTLRNIFGGGYYLERRQGTGLVSLSPVDLTLSGGGLRRRSTSQIEGGVG